MLPVRYSLRNVGVRRGSAVLTMLGVAITVAVFAGVLSLRDGFRSIYETRGSDEILIYLRPGAKSEGESGIAREVADILIKERPEILRGDDGLPLAAMETFLAVYMQTDGGGTTNVPIRGIQPQSIALMGDQVRLVEGRWAAWGSDEVVVGRPLTERMSAAGIGETVMLNLTPFLVVGVYEHDGALGGEVWGDVDRMMAALDRPFYQRVVARVAPGTDVEAIQAELDDDQRATSKVQTEKDYLASQTTALAAQLDFLAGFLTLIMGAAAVLGSTNTMLAAVSARVHEVGVLLALGYSRMSIFVTFLLESALIGLFGGAAGIVLILPFHGMGTGMMNFNTFTDVSFAFIITPTLIVSSFVLAVALGIVGGVLPAWRASRMRPVEALRAL